MFAPRAASIFCLPLLALAVLILSACGGPTRANPIAVTITSPVIPTGGAPNAPSAAPSVTPQDAASPLWVANPSDSRLLRIDPLTNTASEWARIEGAPELVTWDEQWVWVLDRANDSLYRVGTDRQRQVQAVDLPEGDAESIALAGGSLWVGMVGKIDLAAQIPAGPSGPVENPALQAGEDEVELMPPGWVAQVDPATAKVTDRLDVQPVLGLAAQGSMLWVLSRDAIDTPVQVLDLSSRQGMAVPLHNAPEWIAAQAMAVTPEGLWLFSSAHGQIFHADLGGTVHSSVPLEERRPTGYADLLLAGNALWAATPWGVVMKIDPRTNHVQGQVDLGVPLSGLLQGGGSVWALSQQTGALYRLELSGTGISAQIATGSPLQPTIVPSPTPRVVIWQPCPDAAPSRLKVGDIAYVTKDPPVGNRVRKEPELDSEILGLVNPGASVRITGGPTCAEGWVWWQVQNADLSGWTSEGDNETYWLVPLIP